MLLKTQRVGRTLIANSIGFLCPFHSRFSLVSIAILALQRQPSKCTRNLKKKLGLSTPAELTRYAIREGLQSIAT